MSDELDFELVEDSADETTTETNEEITTSEENSKESDEGNTTSTKSKKSNWKKMSKANKAKDKRIAELEAKLAKKESKDSNDYDDDDDDFDEDDEIGFDKTELRFFTIENPEAKDYKIEMEKTLQQYPDMSFEDALTLVKAKTPKPSESSTDFSSKGSNVKVRKKLADLTEEEALKLDGPQYLKYQRLKGKIR